MASAASKDTGQQFGFMISMRSTPAIDKSFNVHHGRSFPAPGRYALNGVIQIGDEAFNSALVGRAAKAIETPSNESNPM